MTVGRRMFGRNRFSMSIGCRAIKRRRSENNTAFLSVNAASASAKTVARSRDLDRFPTRMDRKTVDTDRKKIRMD